MPLRISSVPLVIQKRVNPIRATPTFTQLHVHRDCTCVSGKHSTKRRCRGTTRDAARYGTVEEQNPLESNRCRLSSDASLAIKTANTEQETCWGGGLYARHRPQSPRHTAKRCVYAPHQHGIQAARPGIKQYRRPCTWGGACQPPSLGA